MVLLLNAPWRRLGGRPWHRNLDACAGSGQRLALTDSLRGSCLKMSRAGAKTVSENC
jgi:hypothetical protein